jgi:hypothetical protein
MGLIDEKTESRKSRDTVPLKHAKLLVSLPTKFSETENLFRFSQNTKQN